MQHAAQQQQPMTAKQQQDLTRMMEHAAFLENSLLEQQSEFKDMGVKRKPCLPGFAGHRERCACALCKRARAQHQSTIDRAQTVKTHVQRALAEQQTLHPEQQTLQ
jgi:hypothetical protein